MSGALSQAPAARRTLVFALAAALILPAGVGCGPSLHSAARTGDLLAAQKLIATGVRVEAPGEDGMTALHEAALNGRTALVRALLDAGAGVSAKDTYGHTPLHEAATEGHVDVASMLIRAGAAVDARDHSGATPLCAVCGAVNHGAPPPGYGDAHTTERLSGDPVVTVRLLLDSGADVNAVTRRNETPLLMAAGRRDNPELVRLLLDRGAQVSFAQASTHWTALHLAALLDDTTVAGLLLDRGADVNARDDQGQTPLHWAESGEMAALLVKRGADVDAKDVSGRLPLDPKPPEGWRPQAGGAPFRGAPAGGAGPAGGLVEVYPTPQTPLNAWVRAGVRMPVMDGNGNKIMDVDPQTHLAIIGEDPNRGFLVRIEGSSRQGWVSPDHINAPPPEAPAVAASAGLQDPVGMTQYAAKDRVPISYDGRTEYLAKGMPMRIVEQYPDGFVVEVPNNKSMPRAVVNPRDLRGPTREPATDAPTDPMEAIFDGVGKAIGKP